MKPTKKMVDSVCFTLILMCLGCKNDINVAKKTIVPVKKAVVAVDRRIYGIPPIDIDFKNHKNLPFFKNWFANNYLHINRTSGITVTQSRNNEDLLVYKVSLDENFQTGLNKKYTFCYFKNLKISFLIPIELDRFVFGNADLMIGGYKESRDVDYYYIYRLKNGVMQLILNTAEDCKYGLKVGYYRTDECIEYSPFRFTSKLISIKEIRFYGKVRHYCDSGVDRDEHDMAPKSISEVAIIYKFSDLQQKWLLQSNSKHECW